MTQNYIIWPKISIASRLYENNSKMSLNVPLSRNFCFETKPTCCYSSCMVECFQGIKCSLVLCVFPEFWGCRWGTVLSFTFKRLPCLSLLLWCDTSVKYSSGPLIRMIISMLCLLLDRYFIRTDMSKGETLCSESLARWGVIEPFLRLSAHKPQWYNVSGYPPVLNFAAASGSSPRALVGLDALGRWEVSCTLLCFSFNLFPDWWVAQSFLKSLFQHAKMQSVTIHLA